MAQHPEAPPSRALAILSMQSPAGRCLWIALCLTLILAQVLGSLVVSAGEFIYSDRVLITPFRMCLGPEEGGERRCFFFQGTAVKVKIILALYSPVVLVSFALLAMFVAAYTKERSMLWFSAVCQAASSVLVLSGLAVFLYVNWPYVAWGHMTLWFYTCVGVQVELVVTTALTYMSEKMLVWGRRGGGEPEFPLL